MRTISFRSQSAGGFLLEKLERLQVQILISNLRTLTLHPSVVQKLTHVYPRISLLLLLLERVRKLHGLKGILKALRKVVQLFVTAVLATPCSKKKQTFKAVIF